METSSVFDDTSGTALKDPLISLIVYLYPLVTSSIVEKRARIMPQYSDKRKHFIWAWMTLKNWT